MTRRPWRPTSPATAAEPPGFPSWLSRDVVLLDGRTASLRPILPSDVDELRRRIDEADAETLRSRFLGGRPPHSDRELERLVTVDYDRRLAVVALSPVGRGVGIARYETDAGSDIAEVAIAVDPGWRHVGLATALVRLLAVGAVRNGVQGFSAELFAGNLDVRDLFADTGLAYQTTDPVAGVVTARVTLPSDAADLP